MILLVSLSHRSHILYISASGCGDYVQKGNKYVTWPHVLTFRIYTKHLQDNLSV